MTITQERKYHNKTANSLFLSPPIVFLLVDHQSPHLDNFYEKPPGARRTKHSPESSLSPLFHSSSLLLYTLFRPPMIAGHLSEEKQPVSVTSPGWFFTSSLLHSRTLSGSTSRTYASFFLWSCALSNGLLYSDSAGWIQMQRDRCKGRTCALIASGVVWCVCGGEWLLVDGVWCHSRGWIKRGWWGVESEGKWMR